MAGIRIENSTHAPVDFDTNIATTITAHDAGYIEQELEKIVGVCKPISHSSARCIRLAAST